MSMDRKTIQDSMKQARELIVAGQALLERIDSEKSGYRGEDWPRQPTDPSWSSPESGTLRRRSMDLTRTLAELRKSS